ncbi:MAG: DUF4147 domain-containing protein [Paracoccus sp. (in: a-proteobacteria)]|nr:DUF4147 domain-containing protein [Paracoccus sp. (in: a-proteobacteria)]
MLAEKALALVAHGIAAAEPGGCVTRHMAAVLGDPPGPGGAWIVIAVGKAARAMTGAALEALGPATLAQDALVITNAGNDAALRGARIIVSGHPVPDRAGLEAAHQVEAMLRAARPVDRVLALISGGGSAMLPAPREGISLTEKQDLNRLLLAAGADIVQMNLIRQSLSRLKGGGWLRLSQAPVTALILSDVPGDDLRVVASGPTSPPIGPPEDARAVLRDLGLWPRLSESLRAALMRPRLDADPRPARNILIGGNAQSVAAICAHGAVPGPDLTGDVEDCAARLVRAARDLPPGQAMAMGGETTVLLCGDGEGGRNQELALRFAVRAEAEGLSGPWAFAAIGSDGRDGPGSAAGGVVGPGTLAAMRRAGVQPEAALRRNDSGPALRAAGALVETGATGTNVADLAVFIRG